MTKTQCVDCQHEATHQVWWPKRPEGPYPVCDMCFHHSIKNRGATEYVPELTLQEGNND